MTKTKRHPLLSLLLLVLFSLAGATIFTTLGMILGGIIYGFKEVAEALSIPTWNVDETNIALLKIMHIFSSFGMFVVASLAFAKKESKNWKAYLELNISSNTLFALTMLIMIVASPLLEWTMLLNQKTHLPDIFKGLEDWMRTKEDIAADLTKKMLIMTSLNTFLFNLLALAVIPAIGEELIFRGCLQRIFGRWFGNNHLSIWLTAFIFSAVHMQFFGFLPRMLLGALFGYLLLWSKSLWLPILAHFINNAIVVLAAYVYQQKGLPIDQIDQTMPSPKIVYLLSFAATGILLYIFHRQSLSQINNQANNGTELG